MQSVVTVPRGASNQDVCVVVRMFNEASVVGSVVRDLTQDFARVVCVDDGSTDGSGEIAARHGAKVVAHPINLGAGAALATGLDVACHLPGVRHVITFDADGQHRVEDALRLLAVARANDLDVVLGSRFLDDTSEIPPARRTLLKAAAKFTRITTHVRLTDAHNGLRVFTRDFAAGLRLSIPGMGYASEIVEALASGTVRFAECPVTVLYTDYSRSKGQRNLNAVNIVFELALKRLWATA